MRYILCLAMLLGFIINSGCQSSPSSPDPGEQTPSTPIPSPSEQGEISMTPSSQPPIDAGLQKLIESSKQDLAQRLSISAEEITVVEATAVTWPDSSLGCPQEGMMYAQVLTPGYLIRLQAGNAEYEYHAGKGSTVIYCENPVPPVPGTPGDV